MLNEINPIKLNWIDSMHKKKSETNIYYENLYFTMVRNKSYILILLVLSRYIVVILCSYKKFEFEIVYL